MKLRYVFFGVFDSFDCFKKENNVGSDEGFQNSELVTNELPMRSIITVTNPFCSCSSKLHQFSSKLVNLILQ
jgi:hypothetical protein